jgi:hypothetical protein
MRLGSQARRWTLSGWNSPVHCPTTLTANTFIQVPRQQILMAVDVLDPDRMPAGSRVTRRADVPRRSGGRACDPWCCRAWAPSRPRAATFITAPTCPDRKARPGGEPGAGWAWGRLGVRATGLMAAHQGDYLHSPATRTSRPIAGRWTSRSRRGLRARSGRASEAGVDAAQVEAATAVLDLTVQYCGAHDRSRPLPAHSPNAEVCPPSAGDDREERPRGIARWR